MYLHLNYLLPVIVVLPYPLLLQDHHNACRVQYMTILLSPLDLLPSEAMRFRLSKKKRIEIKSNHAPSLLAKRSGDAQRFAPADLSPPLLYHLFLPLPHINTTVLYILRL